MALQDALGIDGKTYSGQEFRLAIAAFTRGQGGVATITDLKATPNGSPDAKVQVAAGEGIVPATSGALGSYEIPNDAGGLQSPAFAATGANGRWDKLLLQVVAGVPTLVIIQGTPAGSPAYPSLAGQTDYIEICGVKMPPNKSIIDNGANGTIDDRRTVWTTTVVCTNATRPPVPFDGQRIIETDTDNEFIWDAGTSAWFPAKLYVGTAASFPATPPVGTLAYANDANRPTGSVVQGTGRAATPGLFEWAGATSKWDPPWNMPWGILGYVQVTANQTPITTVTDLTSLTLAVTYVANRRICIKAMAVLDSTVGTDVMRLYITDGANTVLTLIQHDPIANNLGRTFYGEVYATPGAGATTYKLRAERFSGTGTLTMECASTFPAYIAIVDEGPNGQPS